MELAFHLPLNRTSLGQLSILILRTLFDREKADGFKNKIYFFPIGQTDLSSQNTPKEFQQWVSEIALNGLENYKREIPVFKLWHLQESLQSLSNKPQNLLSFYELDSPTRAELNIARNNNTFFTSKYTCEVFKNAGVNTKFIALPFDSYNFSAVNKRFFNDERIVFNLCGKFEKRKGHVKVIQSWIKKFGNNPKYSLQCAIYNGFLNEQQNQQLVAQAVNNNKPYNVSFYPHMNENTLYNDFLNSGDIIIGAGEESWDLPSFHAVGMGKHSVILNVNGHKEWATDENSCLFEPDGKTPAYDGIFFQQGQLYNQGNVSTFGEDAFIAACEKAISRVNANRKNVVGLELQTKFTKELFLNNIIKHEREDPRF